MAKLTVSKVLSTVADKFKWHIAEDGAIRAKKTKDKDGECFCPIAAYVSVVHKLTIASDDAGDFVKFYLDINFDMDDFMSAADCPTEHLKSDTFYKPSVKYRKQMLKAFNLKEVA